MKKYKDYAIGLLKNLSFIVPVIIVSILGYGYLLTHSTVNVDTLSADRYYEGIELLGQSRLVGPLLEKIFNIMDFYPFLVDLITVIFLIIAATLFCALFNEVSKGKIKIFAYTIFASFFITYPLVMEIFTYTPMGLSISLGFIAIAISLIVYTEFIKTNKNRYMILTILIIWFAISIYESFAVVYVLGVFVLKAIELMYLEDKKKVITVIKDCILYFLPLLLAVMINYLFAYLFKKAFNIPENMKAAKKIIYFDIGIVNTLKYLFHTIMINYVINAFGYLPITFLAISFILSVTISCIYAIKKKSISILLVFLGAQCSLLLLSIIQGGAAGYRMSQQFQLFVPVIMMLVVQIIMDSNVKKILKNIAIGIICLMLFYQIKDLYHWQYLNDIRYQKEKSDAVLIGNEILSKYDINKPIIFIGAYEMPKNLQKEVKVKENSLHYKLLELYSKNTIWKVDLDNTYISHTNLQSYISFGIGAHIGDGIPGIELIKFFNYLGYDFKPGNMQMLIEALKMKNLPKWPKEGSIFETKEYIVVHF